jgi:hypothetical protein
MSHGPTARDARDFGPAGCERLRHGANDLRYLLARGYGKNAALSLVGDRFRLTQRQRQFLYRCVVDPALAQTRRRRRLRPEQMRDRTVLVDGYNCLIISECLLAGGVVLLADDGVVRDAQGVFGSYRLSKHTHAALGLLVQVLAGNRPRRVVVYLDGRMRYAQSLRDDWCQRLSAAGVPVRASTVLNADRAIQRAAGRGAVVASNDGRIMDVAAAVVDLPAAVAALAVGTEVLDLGTDHTTKR